MVHVVRWFVNIAVKKIEFHLPCDHRDAAEPVSHAGYTVVPAF